jgi:hypothetical protein
MVYHATVMGPDRAGVYVIILLARLRFARSCGQNRNP